MPMEVNRRGVILTLIILASICYILYSNGDETSADAKGQSDNTLTDGEENGVGHPDLSMIKGQDDDDYNDIGVEVEYVQDYVDVDGTNVFYMYAISTVKNHLPPKFPVLLLHGAAFQAETWKTLGTIQYLAKSGYFPVAVDLPGFGKTKSAKLVGDEANFMQNLIETLFKTIQTMPKGEKPVIISPSMSGRFSLPYVFKHSTNVKGFIPIAPVNSYTEKDFKKLILPTLIVYGELDSSGEKTSKIMHNIPDSKIVKIHNGGHPAYLDDPATFHSEIKSFLGSLDNAGSRTAHKIAI